MNIDLKVILFIIDIYANQNSSMEEPSYSNAH